MESQPVEIIICVHNAYDALKNRLDSNFSNTETDYLVTIVDDCSGAIAKRYVNDLAGRRPSPRILRNSENIGSANLSLKAARTDWIVLLDSDPPRESGHPNRLEVFRCPTSLGCRD